MVKMPLTERSGINDPKVILHFRITASSAVQNAYARSRPHIGIPLK